MKCDGKSNFPIMSSDGPPSAVANLSKNHHGRFLPLLDMAGKRQDWSESLPATPTAEDGRIRVADLQRKIAQHKGDVPPRSVGFVDEAGERADDAEFVKPDDEIECLCFSTGGGTAGKPIVPDALVRYRVVDFGISRRLFKAKVPRCSQFTKRGFITEGSVWELWEERMRAPRKGEIFDPIELAAKPENFSTFRLNLVHKRAWKGSPGSDRWKFVGDLQGDVEEPDYKWDLAFYIGSMHEGKRPAFNDRYPDRKNYQHWRQQVAVRQSGRYVFLVGRDPPGRSPPGSGGGDAVDVAAVDDDAASDSSGDAVDDDAASDSSGNDFDFGGGLGPHVQLRFETVAEATKLREALLLHPELAEDFSEENSCAECETLWKKQSRPKWRLGA